MSQDDRISVSIDVPREFSALSDQANNALTFAKEFKITTQSDYDLASDTLKQIKQRRTALEDLRKSLVRPIDEAKRRIQELFTPRLALLTDAEDIYKKLMIVFEDQQERARRAEQARLDEQARKQREALEQRAAAEAAKGRDERAAELQQQAAEKLAPVAAPRVQRSSGTYRRTTWHAECFDVVELCKAIAAGTVAPIAVEPNMTFLNEQARSLHEHFTIPGCKAVEETGLASRRK